jgi:hypothetical protein
MGLSPDDQKAFATAVEADAPKEEKDMSFWDYISLMGSRRL